MGRRGIRRSFCLLPLALLAAAVLPAAARADTQTFLNTDHLYPSQGGALYGPANHYPSTIQVSGLSGTVTNVKVTLVAFDSSSPDDLDLVITGPNGQKVMLMSDACGENPATIDNDTLTFDDSAATFVPNGGSCGNDQVATYKPSNYLGLPVEPDDLSAGGGPAPPYVNALSFLAGSSPNGAWNLYALDDNSGGFVGFGIIGWALTLDTQPSAAGQPASHRRCKKKRRSATAAKKRCKKKR